MDKFVLEKFRHHVAQLEKHIYPESVEIPGFHMSTQDKPAFAALEYDDRDWVWAAAGTRWGGYDQVIWLRTMVEIPVHMYGQELELLLDLGPRENTETAAETLLYINGKPYHGLDDWHITAPLKEEHGRAGSVQISMRCWSGMTKKSRKITAAQLRCVNLNTKKLYYTLKVLLETAEELSEQDMRRHGLLRLLEEAWNLIDFRIPSKEAFYTSVEKALTVLNKKVSQMDFDGTDKPVVAVCGHTHIDMAWLWRIKHTREKAARSFSTVLTLMELYPEYLFSQSSAWLYQEIKENYPDIFERIRQRIAEGRWEITGGMWVEPDTNIPGGESLVRQILLGKGYMKENFDQDVKVLWLPDVFGYSWVLPQLLKKSGFHLFWTNKMCWNQYNPFPYDTFWWRGIDGSEILTQLGTCPEKDVTWGGTYNGVIAPWEVKSTWDKYKQKEINNEVLMPFGWGDGGGGPTREMLEAYPVMKNLPGMPRVEMKLIEDFARGLVARVQDEKVPIWDNEMYFEYHRGTYTSQADIKRNNRKSEILYHDAEELGAMSDILKGQNAYPWQELRNGWEMICLNQFHDIIPGSSIREVYQDAGEMYEEIRRLGIQALNRSREGILSEIKTEEEGIAVFQTLSWDRAAVVKLDARYAGKTLLVNGRKSPSQTVEKEGQKQQLVYLEELPAMGYEVYSICPAEELSISFAANTQRLENPFYDIRFNQAGQITSLYDKSAKREVLKPDGRGNILQVFEDKPHQFDAWNTEIYAFDKGYEVTELKSADVIEQGFLRTTVEFVYDFAGSEIRQRVSVSQISREIVFDTICRWELTDSLLKTAFEVDLRATEATYDIQFGNIKRNTHNNTLWDYAQFEVCAHKWMDISEGNYGVALLNDCKYGMDCKDSVMRLTLIKTSSYPDPKADRGKHIFSYALLPHQGNWKEGQIAQAAYEFNYPVYTAAIPPNLSGTLPVRSSLWKVESGSVMIETVKRAESGDGWILRCYEYMQNRGEAVLTLNPVPCRAASCNLLEEVEEELKIEEGKVVIHFTPYEIKTITVWYDEMFGD